MIVTLDFETQSAVDIRKRGASVYARDPSTVVLCLAYKLPGKETRLWKRTDPSPPVDLYQTILNTDCELHAHNANFEILIWHHVMERMHKAPQIPLNRWRCTAAQAAALALPRDLEGAGAAMNLPIQKDWMGRRIMLKLARPRKASKNNLDTFCTEAKNPDDFQKLYDYCIRDVDTEVMFAETAPDQTRNERYVWMLDQVINERGVPLDIESIEHALRIEEANTKLLNQELGRLTGGRVTTAKQTDKLKWWLNDHDVNIDNVQVATIAAELAKPHSEVVLQVLGIRRELGLASTAKLKAMLARADTDGRVRGAHLYHGASTGRWAGAGIQIQNYPSRDLVVDNDEIEDAMEVIKLEDPGAVQMIWGSTSKALSSLLRPMIKAPPGKRFIVCDFASIEARVLAWVAGEARLLQDFARGVDVYVELAAEIYKTLVKNIGKGERQLGKIAILGCGYGMGGKKFHLTCTNWGVDIDAQLATRVVDTYRETYPRIRKYWYSTNDAALAAVRTGKPHISSCVRFEQRGGFLFCQLPSGRDLAYHSPKVTDEDTQWGVRPNLSYMGINSYSRKWERLRTYGGKLVENIVQAIARDLLVTSMYQLEQAGYPIIATIHDEVVIEIDKGVGSIEEVEKIMSQTPPWAKGCPVAAEGFESERYRK